MAKLTLCAVLCWFALTSGARAAGWELVFSDDFKGAALDRDKWATRYIYDNELCDTFPKNEERQRYTDHGTHVLRDGNLDLVARKVANTGKLDFESGLVRSYQTFYYGYFEARVRAPKAIGTWPAFWLAVDRDKDGNITWPPEIDIFDNANNGRDATSRTIYSGGVDADEGGGPQGGKLVWGAKGMDHEGVFHTPKPLTGAWHVYGMLWTPTKLTLWLDGKMVYVKSYKWVDNDGKLAGPAHVLLNLAVGGPWAGRFGIEDKLFPQTFSVDYVRVCQLTDASSGSRTCGGSAVTPDPVKYAYTTEGAGNDLPRPMLHDTVVAAPSAHAGSFVGITHRIAATVSTHDEHGLYQYLVNARGETVGWQRVELPTPTTQWAGRTLQVDARLHVPAWAEPGRYGVFVSIGTPEEWDAEGKVSLRSLNLRYAPGTKFQKRIGQPTRWKVAELEVVR
jgi:beta-glucanase (GH16 family)